MFDGQTFRSVYKLDDIEIKALPYYFDRLLKECKTKKDFCKHCEFHTSEEYPLHFISSCHFCLDLKHMQFQPICYELYDEAYKQGITALLVN